LFVFVFVCLWRSLTGQGVWPSPLVVIKAFCPLVFSRRFVFNFDFQDLSYLFICKFKPFRTYFA
jgi:hypothetical protein